MKNKQTAHPPKILTRHHHQPQLWLLIFCLIPAQISTPLKFSSEFYPWKLPSQSEISSSNQKKSGAIYPSSFFCSLPTCLAKKLKNPKPKQFRKLELLNRLLPGKNDRLEPEEITPKPKRKDFPEKKHRHFGVQHVTFQGARIVFP